MKSRARYFVAVTASAFASAMLGSIATAILKEVPSPNEIVDMRRQIVAALTLVAIVGGALMYTLCSRPKAQAIGRMLLFAAILAILLAVAPSTVRLVHSP